MAYNVQHFTYDGPGDSLCYGRQDDHNHQQANQFTIDVTAYLQAQGCTHIHAGPFRSNQPEPANGKEFRWNGANWVRV
ncbi:hypothetical protein [Tenacibaculum sp. 190524A05c]|uniref:hypothetical protein n=1 Tax=Tenacibaculum platacis TaxID=3137852 RepID=UPI0031FB44E6